MARRDPPVLDYLPPQGPQPVAHVFPLGIISLTLGTCAAIVFPILDAVTQLPGYLQVEAINLPGIVVAVLAIGTGTGAVFLRSQPTRGIIGAGLGFVGGALIASLARA